MALLFFCQPIWENYTIDTRSEKDAERVHSVSDILDELRQIADHHDKVSVGDALDAIGHRSYGPAILIPALIEITPIGGIPGVPTFLALVIAIAAGQLLFDKDHLWLPRFIQKRSVAADKLHRAADTLVPIARRLDNIFHGRLPRFVKRPWPSIAATIVIMLCLTVPPLELLPFASTAPMLAIAAFGLALLMRDGLLMLVALGISALAVALGATLIP